MRKYCSFISFAVANTSLIMTMQMVVLTAYAYLLYGRLTLSLSGGLEQSRIRLARAKGETALKAAMASESVVQLGLLMALPMIMEIGLERGLITALSEMIIMQLQLAAVFFTFFLDCIIESQHFVHTQSVGTVSESPMPLQRVCCHTSLVSHAIILSPSSSAAPHSHLTFQLSGPFSYLNSVFESMPFPLM